jgi:predicted Zn-dependent protease
MKRTLATVGLAAGLITAPAMGQEAQPAPVAPVAAPVAPPEATPVAAAPAPETLVQAPAPAPASTTANAPLAEPLDTSFNREFNEVERRLRLSGARVTDAALVAFTERLACDVTGGYCKDVRLLVIDDADFNASMAPNGMMLVHTGLLLRAETEAELAYVLAHEFGHYRGNHAAKQMAVVRSANRSGTVLTLALMMAGAGAFAQLGMLPGALNAFGFSRDQEREADRVGAMIANELGYDTRNLSTIWKNLNDELAASSNKARRRDNARASMFDTHPLTTERMTFLAGMGQPNQARGLNKVAYRAKIRPYLNGWLSGVVAKRDYGAALQLFARLDQVPGDEGLIAFHRGEIYRLRAEAGDDQKAIESFTASVAKPDAPAIAFRQLGLMQKKTGAKDAAISALNSYLTAAPDAADRELIALMLKDLEGKTP